MAELLGALRFYGEKTHADTFPSSEEPNKSFRLLKEESLVKQDSLIPLIWNNLVPTWHCQVNLFSSRYIFDSEFRLQNFQLEYMNLPTRLNQKDFNI